MTLLTFLKISVIFNLILVIPASLFVYLITGSNNDTVKNLVKFFKAEDWGGAREYLKKINTLSLKELVDPMINMHDRPYRILLEWDKAKKNVKFRLDLMTIISQLGSALWLAGLCYMVYIENAGMTGWIYWAIGLTIAVRIIWGVVISRYNTVEGHAIMVRNQLFYSLDYLPPEYTGKSLSAQERKDWEQAIEAMERNIMAGIDPERASNEALSRARAAYARLQRDDGSYRNVASSRLGMLRGDEDDAS